MILPSAPHVVYKQVSRVRNTARKELTRSEPDGCHVALRTALVWPSSIVIFVMSSRSMTLTVGSLWRCQIAYTHAREPTDEIQEGVQEARHLKGQPHCGRIVTCWGSMTRLQRASTQKQQGEMRGTPPDLLRRCMDSLGSYCDSLSLGIYGNRTNGYPSIIGDKPSHVRLSRFILPDI